MVLFWILNFTFLVQCVIRSQDGKAQDYFDTNKFCRIRILISENEITVKLNK